MSKKRGNGEGSITKRKDGAGEPATRSTPPKGPKRKNLYGRTRQRWRASSRSALSDRAQGSTFDAGSLKVERVPRPLAMPNIRRHGQAADMGALRADSPGPHQAALGRIKLKALTPTHVRGLYREKLEAGLSSPHGAIRPHDAAQGPEGRRGRWTRSAQRDRRHQTPET